KEDKPKEKEVDGQHRSGIGLDGGPCLFHVGTPVDVVEDQDGGWGCVGDEGVEIMQGRCEAMVAVYKRQVDLADPVEDAGEMMVEIAGENLSIDNVQAPEVPAGDIGYG